MKKKIIILIVLPIIINLQAVEAKEINSINEDAREAGIGREVLVYIW